MPPVVIVGGGISGLSAAYYLARRGVASTLVEARPRLGGVIQTERIEGCLIEAGPDSFLSMKPAAMELIGELGLSQEVIGSNDHLRKTYVLKRGRLTALPDGLMMMVPTKVLPLALSPLLGWRTKLRMGLEWFRKPSSTPAGDQSVAAFVREHYGQEAVDYLAEPLLSGVYGGNPEALSIASVLPRFVELSARHGSLTRGVLEARRAARREAGGMPLFRTLKGGLGQLVEAVAAASRSHMTSLHGRADAVERTASGYRVRVAGEWLETGDLVLATEAHQAAPLMASIEPRLAELLAAVPYSSSMTVALAFDDRAFRRPLQGFGFLVPKKERRSLVACTWVGTKFPFRAPPGTTLLRCFLGGMDGGESLDRSDAAVLRSVLEELRGVVDFEGEPRFHRVFRWPRSMAQYTVGHVARMREFEGKMAEIPGLHVAGNAYSGIGVPDCIRMGREAAFRIASP